MGSRSQVLLVVGVSTLGDFRDVDRAPELARHSFHTSRRSSLRDGSAGLMGQRVLTEARAELMWTHTALAHQSTGGNGVFGVGFLKVP